VRTAKTKLLKAIAVEARRQKREEKREKRRLRKELRRRAAMR
jgi:hypothetical protein